MNSEDFVNTISETGSMAVIIYAIAFLLAVTASIVGVAINPILLILGTLMLVFVGIAYQSYQESSDRLALRIQHRLSILSATEDFNRASSVGLH